MSSERILIVEDSVITCRQIDTSLKNMGYDVAARADSGEESIKMANKVKPDLVLMDINLKGKMAGIEAAQEIRDTLRIPVIFLISLSDDDMLEKAATAEPFGYLLKPVDEHALKATIHMALHKHAMEEKLCENENKLSAILRSSPMLQFVIDRDFKVINWNEALEKYSRIKAKDILGTNQHWRAFYPQERPCMADILVDGAIEKIPQWYSGKYVKSNMIEDAYGATDFFPHMGESGTWLYFTAAPIHDTDGRIIGAVETLEDITDRKLAEDALRAAEDKFSTVFRSSPDMISISELDTGRFIDVNDAAVRILGYSRGEFIGKNSLDLGIWVHPEERATLIQRVRKEGRVNLFETEHMRKNGDIFVAAVSADIITLGGTAYLIATMRDISTLKRAEHALKESEERYRMLFETMIQGVVYQDIKGHIIGANPAAERILGRTLDQMRGSTSIDPRWKAVHADGSCFSKETHPAMIALQTGKEVRNVTMGVYNPVEDGYTWISINAVPQFHTTGNKPYQVFTTFEDITERKNAEDAQRESEARFRTMADWTNDWEYWTGRDMDMVYVSPSIERITGYTADEFLADKGLINRIVHPDDRALWKEHLMLYVGGEQSKHSAEIEFRIITKDSTTRWIGHTCRAIFADNGAWVGRRISNRDITEHKQAEEEQVMVRSWQAGVNRMLESVLAPMPLENKLRIITDGVVDTFGADFCRIWLIDNGDRCSTGCIHAEDGEGPHVCRYRDKCLHLKASSGRYTHIDGKAHSRVPFGAYKIGRIASGEETKFLINDVVQDPRVHDHEWAKSLGLVAFSGYQLKPPDGDVLGVFAMFARFPISPDMDAILEGLSRAISLAIQKDIADKASRESEERYRGLVETTSDWVWEVDENGVYTYVSPQVRELIGYTSGEVLGKTPFDFMPADKAVRAGEIFRTIVTTQKPFSSLENINLHKDGRIVILETSGVPVFRQDGQIGGYRGIDRDITGRKSEETYRQLSIDVLGILNEPDELHEVIRRVLQAIKLATNADAIGIRLVDADDFPYFVENGFSRDFLLKENSLVARDQNGGICRDSEGNVRLACTCGLVISGKTDPENPLFTPNGSFWTNNSFPILNLPEKDDPRFHPRNTCIHNGYASFALIPIRKSPQQIIGTLQINAFKKDCFTPEIIQSLELIAGHIGGALLRRRAEESLRDSERTIHNLLNAVPDDLVLINNERMIIAVNESMAEKLGQRPEALAGRAIGDFLTSSVLSGTLDRIVDPTMTVGQIYFEEKWNDRWLETFVFPVTDRTGTDARFAIQSHDITHRKHLEEELKKEGLSQIEHNIEKFQILNDQIRNPLQVIRGYLSLVDTKYNNKINKQVDIIDNIVTQLDMGWLESEKVQQFLIKHSHYSTQSHPEQQPAGGLQ